MVSFWCSISVGYATNHLRLYWLDEDQSIVLNPELEVSGFDILNISQKSETATTATGTLPTKWYYQCTNTVNILLYRSHGTVEIPCDVPNDVLQRKRLGAFLLFSLCYFVDLPSINLMHFEHFEM